MVRTLETSSLRSRRRQRRRDRLSRIDRCGARRIDPGSADDNAAKSVERSIRPGEISYPVQVDIEQAKSVDEFFKIAIAQFGRIDASFWKQNFPSDRR
jgi:NAD(P)-dependent dehydrogenase (short-subunit alcohol dehydrogenase family)